MKRSLIILLIGVFVVIVAVAGYFYWQSRQATTTPGNTPPPAILPPSSFDPPLPNNTPGTIPQGDTIKIQSQKGTVEVKNFYKSAEEISDSLVILPSGGHYYLDYQPGDGSFLMQLMVTTKEEATAARAAGEQQLLSLLDISKNDACKLDTRVIVPGARDLPGFQDINYGLSFCTGSVSF